MISGETGLGRDRYRVRSMQKCFTSKLCLFHVSLFGLFKYLVKTSMELKNILTLQLGVGVGGTK